MKWTLTFFAAKKERRKERGRERGKYLKRWYHSVFACIIRFLFGHSNDGYVLLTEFCPGVGVGRKESESDGSGGQWDQYPWEKARCLLRTCTPFYAQMVIVALE
ncbi:hypothetical protein NC652_024307 [Populus alba x Populus x berolinensis]|nr:hypothetical protein NC652_024307 [Populus alba x Populus x berolinensis]